MKALIPYLLAAAVAVSAWAWIDGLRDDLAEERAARAHAERELAVAEEMHEQARLAAEVAKEATAREARRAEQLDVLLSEIEGHPDANAPAPDLLRDVVRRLRP